MIFDITIAKRLRLAKGSDDGEHFFSYKVVYFFFLAAPPVGS